MKKEARRLGFGSCLVIGRETNCMEETINHAVISDTYRTNRMKKKINIKLKLRCLHSISRAGPVVHVESRLLIWYVVLTTQKTHPLFDNLASSKRYTSRPDSNIASFKNNKCLELLSELEPWTYCRNHSFPE